MAIREGVLPVLLLLLFAPAPARSEVQAEGPECLGPSCHTAPETSPGAHPPARDGRCTACHRPGRSFSPRLHEARSFDAPYAARLSCLGCHERARETAESAPFLHRPFEEGPCTACHSPHSSAVPPLLRAAYPPSVHSSFDRDVYALCWECHASSLATEKFSELATAFRLGSRNFHFSHLQKRKGMTCRACHLPHGGLQPRLVRDIAPGGFPGWIDTMRFLEDSAGGRCAGGCHKDISYRR